MERARKKLASALDGIRNLTVKLDLDINERLTAEDCCLSEIVRHGFPDSPRCIDVDPVQRLVVIGASHGYIRFLGQAGVDFYLKHNSDEPVTHVQFLINEGGLITALRDDTIHLWNYRQKKPEIVHSIKMAKEHVTAVYLPFQSKWLHIGTDKGNVYFLGLADFELSTYVINWNKAIDINCRTHPGCVRSMSISPTENSKLLILYEKGPIVLWNIITKESERFGLETAPVKCMSWHYDGKQFMCGHKDGSLTIWNLKKPKECVQKTTPHAPLENAVCRPITHLHWNANVEGEQMILFSGGMPTDDGALPAVTILRSKGSITVLEMDHSIVDLCLLVPSPFTNSPRLPFACITLLKSDLLVIDLQTNGTSYPCFELPHPMDIHESPITFIRYISNCSVELLGALTLVGRNQRRQGVQLSNKPWPLTGGIGRECATGHDEILITGHEDGSLKFWQASGENLQILYKLKTGRHFEKSNEARNVNFSVQEAQLYLESQLLLVAGVSGQLTCFRFVKTESSQEVPVVLLPQLVDSSTCRSTCVSPTEKSTFSVFDEGKNESVPEIANPYPIKVRSGSLRRPAGYQPEFVCQIPWSESQMPTKITAMAMNSVYGVLAIGTAAGVALVNTATFSLIHSVSSAELFTGDAVSFPSNTQNLSCDASPDRLSARRKQLKTAYSTVTPPSFTSSNSGRSFVRLNTECRQRSTESRPSRPTLSKAQSVAVSAHDNHLEPSANGLFECSSELFEGDLSSRSERRSQSPSPSTSSVDKGHSSAEFATSFSFISSSSRKGCPKMEPSVWIGSSTGSVIPLIISLPTDRSTNAVTITPSGTTIRLPSHILSLYFLNAELCVVSGPAESAKEKESNSPVANSEYPNRILTKSSYAPTVANSEDEISAEDLSQIGIFVSEEEIRSIALPGFISLYSRKLDIPLVKVRISHLRGSPCLFSLNAAGHVCIFTVPSLKPLFNSSLFKCSVEIDDPIVAKTDFSEHGLGMYMATPSEIQKFTVSSEVDSQMRECSGELFVPCDMPEPPKASFFRGVSTLFGGTQKEAPDLDTIFSEKPPSYVTTTTKNVARPVAAPVTSMDAAHRQNISAGQAATMAIQNLNERTERLNAVVDATEQLRGSAMSLQSRSAKLVEKYEKKKWFQL